MASFSEKPGNISTLRSVPELTSLRVSKSSKDNLKRASPGGSYDFAAYAKQNGSEEPAKLSKRSPLIVLNYLAEITNLNKLEEHRARVRMGEASSEVTPVLKSIDSLNGYVQGLSQLFEKHGHVGKFCHNPVTDQSTGNPIESEETCIHKFRRRYKALLAELGLTEPKQASHLGIDELLALSFLQHSEMSALNMQMFAICLLGTNLILRFDEVVKLRMESVTLYQSCPKTKILLSEKCKNSTYTREYICEPWGGRLSGCLRLDPSFCLLSWILIRGDTPGYLFCTIRGNRMNFEKPLQAGSFVTWLQESLLKRGEGQDSVRGFRLHSLKRGGVQVWKSLGRDDRWIMRRMHATGFAAFLRYAYSGKGAWPAQIPEFSTLHAAEDYIAGSMTSLLLDNTELTLPEIACIDDEEDEYSSDTQALQV